jgi:hypothetical protein
MPVTYTVHRHSDVSFFNWLAQLNPSRSGEVAHLNKELFCTYVAYDALAEWVDKRIYILPGIRHQISNLTYFGSSEGRRLYCAALFADGKRALLFEVFTLQLLLLPYGIRHEGSTEILAPGLRYEIHLPDDKKPVSNIFSQQDDYAGLMLSEETQSDPLAQVNPQTGLKPVLPNRLRIDACLPELAYVHFNQSPVLETLLGA